ncbi:hypothetical protein V8F33_007483 [Rhypophila sp. PSN 637]
MLSSRPFNRLYLPLLFSFSSLFNLSAQVSSTFSLKSHQFVYSSFTINFPTQYHPSTSRLFITMLPARLATAGRSFAVAGRRTTISLPRNAQLQRIMFLQKPRFGSSQNGPKALDKPEGNNDINIISESRDEDDRLLKIWETSLRDKIKSDVQNGRMELSEFSYKLHVLTRIQLRLTQNRLKSLENDYKHLKKDMDRDLEATSTNRVESLEKRPPLRPFHTSGRVFHTRGWGGFLG